MVNLKFEGALGVTKADIVEQVQKQCGLTKKDSFVVTETVFKILKTTLESGENVKISGFGNFVVNHKNARRGRNPQTGEMITIESRKILTFKPSNILRKKLNA
jgi:integration host factor subunit alpha